MARIENEKKTDREKRDEAMARAFEAAEKVQSKALQQAKAKRGPIELPTPAFAASAGPAAREGGRSGRRERDEAADKQRTRRDLIRKNDPSGLERVVGRRDIVSTNYLERALRVGGSVCRIKTLSGSGGLADFATGFLIGPNLLVTNNHVLPDPDVANWSLAEFDYELDVNFVDKRGRIFPFAPHVAFFTSAEFDFTVVAVSPMAHDGTPLSDFGMIRLIPESGKGLPGEHVSIIQHPAGGTKQVVLRENRIIELDPAIYREIRAEFIHYTSDTERGSSGSPVFNDQWDLVAVHHRAIAARNAQDQCLRRDGKVWDPADGEDAIKWIGNEGVRASAIFRTLRGAAATDPEAAKIMAILALDPSSARRPRELADPDGEPGPGETLPNTPDAPAFESTHFTDPAFTDSMGFKTDFLGAKHKVPLPKTTTTFIGTLAVNDDFGDAPEAARRRFDYTHFSLAMHVERRLAVWTAVNIDGEKLKSSKKEPGWRRDKRLPASQQTLAEVYGKVPGKTQQIDRGHLVRRLDPVWGPQEVADRAAQDTFHYTNAAPQEHHYNSETWGDLEDFVLARAENRDHKVSVLTGPVLRPDDKLYGDGLKGGPWQIPWSFWKIAVFVREDGTLSVTGFEVKQTRTLSPIFEASKYNPYTVEEARVFQRPVKVIEEMTGLDFGDLRTFDRMGDVESTSAGAARAIRGPNDIAF